MIGNKYFRLLMEILLFSFTDYSKKTNNNLAE